MVIIPLCTTMNLLPSSDRWGWEFTSDGTPCVAHLVWEIPTWTSCSWKSFTDNNYYNAISFYLTKILLHLLNHVLLNRTYLFHIEGLCCGFNFILKHFYFSLLLNQDNPFIVRSIYSDSLKRENISLILNAFKHWYINIFF